MDPDIIVSGGVGPDQAGETPGRDLPVPSVTSSTGRQTIWQIIKTIINYNYYINNSLSYDLLFFKPKLPAILKRIKHKYIILDAFHIYMK